MNKRIAIVGGGILGLTLAYRLAKSGKEVSLFETGKEWGGLASALRTDDYQIEKYYHHWFRGDQSIIDLIHELEIEDKLIWPESSMGVYYEGKLYNLSMSYHLLTFKPLSLINRVRFALVSFYLQKTKNYQKFEKQSAYEWCLKNFGKQVTEIIWKPLLIGKFGEKHYQNISMSWLWARIHDRASSRPNPLGKETLGYMEGGFQVVVDRLVEVCQRAGVKMHSEAPILGHAYEDYTHILSYSKKGKSETESFDIVVSTVPGPIFNKIFKVAQQQREQIDNIKYIGASCMILELSESLLPYYWLNVNDTSFPFMAVVEHTNFIDKSEYSGKRLLYIAKYQSPDNDYFQMDEEELFELYLTYLKKLNPKFSEEWVTKRYYFKSAFAQHIVSSNYQVPEYQTNIPGLFYANFSQVYPHDRGTNYAVAQANELSDLILNN